MSGSLRAVLPILLASLTLSGCTQEGPRPEASQVARSEVAETDTRDFVADSSIALPPAWSYNVARQGADSWQFSISPFPFNLGRRCDRETGALVGGLFRRAEVFITGFAYVDDFPGAADTFKQSPGEFVLDDTTLANYEGFCHPTYRIDFELGDHYISMHVAVHRKATEATVAQALDVLNSIH